MLSVLPWLAAKGGAPLAEVARSFGVDAEVLREDLREGGVTVCNTLVRSYLAYQRAAELGVLARDVRDPRALAAWADIETLSRELW